MNTSFENYENKIDFIITNIKNNNKIKKTHKENNNENKKNELKTFLKLKR